jgi:hypothetical protein
VKPPQIDIFRFILPCGKRKELWFCHRIGLSRFPSTEVSCQDNGSTGEYAHRQPPSRIGLPDDPAPRVERYCPNKSLEGVFDFDDNLVSREPNPLFEVPYV